MNRASPTILLLAACLLASGTSADVKPLPAQAASAANALRQGTQREWALEWDEQYQQVARLHGRSVALDPDPERAARRFLRSVAPTLELAPDLADLELVHMRRTPAGTHLQFAQRANGMPVYGGGIDVHVSRAGEVFLVQNRYLRTGTRRTVAATPIVSEKAALAIATAADHARTDKAGHALGKAATARAAQPELGIERASGGAELAWRFTADGFRYKVSATTAQVLERVPVALSVNGTGRVFDPNPVNVLGNTSLRDYSNTNYPEVQGAYSTGALLGIQQLSSPTRFRLRGPYVRTFDATTTFFNNSLCGADGNVVAQPPPERTTSSFLYNRSQPEFEHTMVYFHLDRSQRYIQGLGFPELLNTGIQVDAHAFSVDNSYFCPGITGTGYIAFGNGGVDDAEDADVVLHEYGHAIQEDSSNGRYDGIGLRGAMGEGFGDYWAFTARPTGFKPACFAEWDVGDGTCLRRLDGTKKAPADLEHEVHADGEIWSRALRDLHLAVGKTVADTIILQSHYLVPVKPGFAAGAQALLDADEALYAGAHAAAICQVTTARGIVAPDC